MKDARLRRGYLDWLRGLAVVVMIEAHVLDSWTRVADRGSWQFAWAMIAGGFGAPLFLFLAGVSVALSAGSKARRSGDAKAAAATVMRRGLWVFGLAFLFRVQAWVLGWSAPGKLLKVDILNIMGPAIIASAALWGRFRSPRARCAAFAAATLTIAYLTPIVRTATFLDPLPDPLEAYLRPVPALSTFCLFPWAGFVFAGGLVGVLLDGARTRETESPLNAWIFGGGAAVAIASYLASFLPSAFVGSTFWGSSPAFFLLRAGVITAAVGLAYAWDVRPWARRWSPMQQLGRTSLFIYWIHVEMAYGLISLPLHKHLSHEQAWIGVFLFSLFMLLCSVAKDRVVAWWRDRAAPPPVLVAQ
ncbi:MAG: heparan-alpha-glucosaminide N-acetyltransferase domain-containing protein [Acidobacteriota bacterium]